MKVLATTRTDSFKKDLRVDIGALGIIITSDAYIVLNKFGLITGADKFLNSISNYQVALMLISLFLSNLLIYIIIDYFRRKEILYKLCSFAFGSNLSIMVYILSVKLGCTMGLDDRVILLEYSELFELIIYQIIFLCLISSLFRLRRSEFI